MGAGGIRNFTKGHFEELEQVDHFWRYFDQDGDGIPYRTLPGVDPKGAYFTRGSGHNAQGKYTEDSDDYREVMDRLTRKFETAAELVPGPVIIEKNRGDMAILSVGSCDGAVREALEILSREGISLDYLRVRAFPFSSRVQEFLDRHDRIFVIEQNRDAQLRTLLISETRTNPEKLLSVLGKQITLLDAFRSANDVLLGAVQGIAELITRPGLINVDFADVRTVMSEMGMAMMGTGNSKGENRAREAAERAINSPLLDDIDLQGARGILVNITAGLDLSLGEFSEVGDTIEEFASEEATVVVGTVIDPEMTDELKVTVVATGLGSEAARAPLQVVDTPTRTQAAQPAEADEDVAETPDYKEYDLPATRRQRGRAAGAISSTKLPTTAHCRPKGR